MSNEDHDQPGEDAKDDDKAEGDSHWVKGADGKEKDTYRDFLRYCEERRNAWHAQEQEDQERRMEAGRSTGDCSERV